jgi:hypothetical protein
MSVNRKIKLLKVQAAPSGNPLCPAAVAEPKPGASIKHRKRGKKKTDLF